jgi:quercetin dioxygenase-like cupin family protein
MAAHSRPKDGVASLAYVPAIHGLGGAAKKGVDARHKAGHDAYDAAATQNRIAGSEAMSQKAEFHNLAKPDDGLLRELAKGVTTRIFAGEHAMLSVVTIAPNAEGVMHHHPEEQWGVLLEGSAVRFQGGEEIAVKKGDFWRTPGNVPHTMRAGPDGARVLDIFSPPRPEYKKAGKGFG